MKGSQVGMCYQRIQEQCALWLENRKPLREWQRRGQKNGQEPDLGKC